MTDIIDIERILELEKENHILRLKITTLANQLSWNKKTREISNNLLKILKETDNG